MKLLVCTQAVNKNHPILGFFHGWILEFAKHFDEVHVICLEKGEYQFPDHVFVYSLGKEARKSKLTQLFLFYKIFSHVFFKVRVDFVFFHMGAIYNVLAAPFFIVRKLIHTKFYWWKAHGHINAFGKFALVFVDSVYTSTQSGFVLNTKKRRIIGQAIDTTHFVFPASEESRIKEIIFVGRIMPVKHLEDFLDTAQLLYKEDTSLSFTIIGPIGDQAYFKMLQERCVAHSLQEVVTFAGSKTHTELVALYQRASVFFNTSLTHSMDKTVLEAILCGCVPVTSNKAFIDLLEQEGLYVKEAVSQEYYKVIKQVLTQEESQRNVLQRALRQNVVLNHSLDTLSKRIFNI